MLAPSGSDGKPTFGTSPLLPSFSDTLLQLANYVAHLAHCTSGSWPGWAAWRTNFYRKQRVPKIPKSIFLFYYCSLLNMFMNK